MAFPEAAERSRNLQVEPWPCGSRGISVVVLHLIPLNFITPIVTAAATFIVSRYVVFSLASGKTPGLAGLLGRRRTVCARPFCTRVNDAAIYI
jgi:hypothetical protein